MVDAARRDRRRVEIITNGTTMIRRWRGRLVDLGVAQVTVSLDGGDDESRTRRCAERRGRPVIDGLAALRDARRRGRVRAWRSAWPCVATRRNVASLPALLDTARAAGRGPRLDQQPRAAHARVGGRDPVALRRARVGFGPPTAGARASRSRAIDFDAITRPLVEALWRAASRRPAARVRRRRRGGTAVASSREGVAAVTWDGRVAPCLSLLYYAPGVRRRARRRRSAGDAGRQRARTAVRDIWRDRAYRDFRRRVRAFDCLAVPECGGCSISTPTRATASARRSPPAASASGPRASCSARDRKGRARPVAEPSPPGSRSETGAPGRRLRFPL